MHGLERILACTIGMHSLAAASSIWHQDKTTMQRPPQLLTQLVAHTCTAAHNYLSVRIERKLEVGSQKLEIRSRKSAFGTNRRRKLSWKLEVKIEKLGRLHFLATVGIGL